MMTADMDEDTTELFPHATSVSDEADGAASNIRTNNFALMNGINMSIAMLGMVGNAMVLVVAGHSKAMRKQFSTMFIISQSVLDLLVSLSLLLYIAFPYSGGLLVGLSGVLWCQLWMTNIWLWTFNLSSTWNFVALTLERYFEVVRPIKHKVFVTAGKIKLSLVVIWLLGLLYNLAINLNTTAVVNGKCNLLMYWASKEAQFFFGIMNSAIKFVIPCLVFIMCYSHMAWFLHKRKSQIGSIGVHNTVREVNMERARNNVLKTLIWVAAAYIICCSWNQVVFMLFNAGVVDASVFLTAFFDFSVGLYNANCMVNPFIYAFKYKQFQKSLKELLMFCRSRSNSIMPINTENRMSNEAQQTSSTFATKRSYEGASNTASNYGQHTRPIVSIVDQRQYSNPYYKQFGLKT